MSITIDQEFKSLIPPLSSDEYDQLEANLLAGGCRDPLVVWGDVLMDGHNRFEICERHGLPFSTVQVEFESRADARIWMRNNQMGRRSLTDGWRIELALGNKADLIEIGRAKMSDAKIAERKAKAQGLSTNDKPSESLVEASPAETQAPWLTALSMDEEEFTAEDFAEIHSTVPFVDKTEKPINTQKSLAEVAGVSTGKLAQAEVVRRDAPEIWEAVKSGDETVGGAYQKLKSVEKSAKLEAKKAEIAKTMAASVADNKPVIFKRSFDVLLAGIDDGAVDLLITDPPYSTDVEDIGEFASSWLPLALSKVCDTGRAYICIGAYPAEFATYLNLCLNQLGWIVDNPLIWTYRNTLGVTPKNKYNLNYQVILHLYREKTPELDTSITGEMFSVQDINAPDGRQGDRFHTWQKPMELAERLIRHGSKTGDTILDPFACTGTFSIAAAKLGRKSVAGDVSADNLKIAEERGCEIQD